MPFIALYIIKLSISLAMVYFFYVLLLRRLTFYNWNRWYLLGYSLLAFYMPFIDISPVVQQADWKGHALIYYIPVLENIPHQQVAYQQPFNYQAVFLYVFVAGALVLLARLLMQYLSYRNIRKSARLLYDDGVQLYQVDKPIAPFSFGKAIYINHQHLEQAELEKIVRHEFVHVQQKHSLDIIIGEFICILNWYNPFAWLIRRSIRQNLEFIADQQVLENGIDRKQYQYLLLKVTGNHHYGFTSPFNFSFLKKRIIMMNKIASARIHLCRFAFLLPLMAVSLLSFRSIARQQNAVQQTETAGKNTGAFIITKKAKTDAAISTEPARSVSARSEEHNV